MPYPCCCNQTPTGDPICLEGDPIAPADLIAYVNITWNSGAIGGTAPNTYPRAVTTAFSVPAGLSRDRLPVGVQLVGPAGSEALLLRIARVLEDGRREDGAPPGAVA